MSSSHTELAGDLPPHTSPDALGVTVIRGGVRRPLLRMLREAFAYRGVFFALVRRSITTRYRQSLFGLLWILAAPLSSALTYTVFLGRFAGVKGDNRADYLLFTLVGQVLWGIFLRGGVGGIGALVSNTAFVKKVYFPRVLLPLANVGQSIADFLPAMLMMFGLAWATGAPPRVDWLLLVIPVVTVLLFCSAFAMAASAITVYVRDLNFAAPLISQFGMLASAVVYPLSAIPEAFRTGYAILNPIAGAADNARGVIYRGDGLNVATTLGGLAWTVFCCVGAFALFTALEKDAADRI